MQILQQKLADDVRYAEGLNACMNCGICTGICPAAEFYPYDPRSIVTIAQSKDEQKIKELLASDNIWYCGQCMSCKTRCPRGNCPGQIISVLRKISQETGLFTQSRLGRQQYLIRNSIGSNLMTFGYCVHPSQVKPENHPEQGPVWEWVYENRNDVYQLLGGNLDQDGTGALRKISEETLAELHQILHNTGAISMFDAIDEFSQNKALELGLVTSTGKADMEAYTRKIESEN